MAPPNSNQDWADKQVFTTGEAAEICKVSQQTIIRCFDSGRLQGFRVPGSRFRRIPRSDLIRFMKTNDIPLDILEPGRKRVLVVDDEPEISALLKEALESRGDVEVTTCANGYDAGLFTNSFKPHLIILDYMLPDINGDQVCTRLRQNEETSSIKVLFVSGVVNQTEVNDLLRAGADDFMKKPFDIEKLSARVAELLDLEVTPTLNRDKGAA